MASGIFRISNENTEMYVDVDNTKVVYRTRPPQNHIIGSDGFAYFKAFKSILIDFDKVYVYDNGSVVPFNACNCVIPVLSAEINEIQYTYFDDDAGTGNVTISPIYEDDVFKYFEVSFSYTEK